MATTKEWWETFFKDFHPVLQSISKRKSNSQARQIVKLLGLKKGSAFLDCPCGTGRISLPVAAMGIRVTAVDITGDYLEELSAEGRRRTLRVHTNQVDMRRITFHNEFDAAINLGSSFGYFSKHTDNLLVLKRLFSALKPGGRALVSNMNRDWIILNFRPDNWYDIGEVRVLQKRVFDYATSVMQDEWRFIKDGKERLHKSFMRLYSFHELREMFKQAGFIDIQGYGDLEKAPTERTNSTLHVIGVKPRSKRK